MTNESQKAIEEWKAGHRVGKGWEPIGGGYHKRLPYVVLYDLMDDMPYTVQYAGTGIYFQNLKDLVSYLVKRGWNIPETPEEV